MRQAPLALILLLLAPVASAAETRLDLEAVSGPTFRLQGQQEPNPRLEAAPGANLTLRLANVDSRPHSLRVGEPLDVEIPCCVPPGQVSSVQVSVPLTFEGDVAYWCAVHPEQMSGILHVGNPSPRVTILEPAFDSTVTRTFTVRVDVQNLALVSPGRDPYDGQGHLHYLLDGALVADTLATTHELQTLAPGHHIVAVEAVANDHKSFDPPARVETLVYIPPDAPDSPSPAPSAPTPAPTNEAPGFGALLLVVALALAARRAR